jgi:streptogramin lyase
LDKYGNLWIDSTATSFLFFLDRETHKFQRYPAVVPKELPAESQIAWAMAPGETGTVKVASSYDIKVDSKGKVWYTELGLGALNSFDPVTKKSKQYKIPGVISSRGVAVDSKDNVWFSNWDGHTIVKFDQKTGQSRQYQPPTHFATAYGLVFDHNGYLWFADYAGNQITRFDPKTEGFVEYPLPTAGAMPRFIDVDKYGRVYFCEWWQSRVGVLDPGSVTKTSVVASAK